MELRSADNTNTPLHISCECGRTAPVPAMITKGYEQHIDGLEAENRFLRDALKEALRNNAGPGSLKEGPGQEECEAYIKKGVSAWEFGFNDSSACVGFKPSKELKGLALIALLLSHPNKEYMALELLKEVGQRGEEETEPEKIVSEKDILRIKEAIAGLRARAAEETIDLEKKWELEEEADKAEAELRKVRNCNGKSRKISEKYTKSASRNIETVLKKIATQNIELYNHLNTFLIRGEICSYKPDNEIIWEIS